MSPADLNPQNSTDLGGIVAAIDPGSAAERAGLKPGDRLLQLGGRRLSDMLDYQFYLEPGEQPLEVERGGQRLSLTLDCPEDEDPGIAFAAALFDRVHVCRNKCLFCFVHQLPRGLRRSLYLKDDDFRLSFLHGNFTTLNTLSEAELARLIEQRLSPLYVSVHASDAAVRARLMGCAVEQAAEGLANLTRLDQAGIEVHVQIVLCPGINDGAVLERTVTALAADYENIASLGVVPVAVGEGLRAAGHGLRPLTEKDCHRLVEFVTARQGRFRRQWGSGWLYAADEFYLRAGAPLPSVEDYDEFAQYENGIGIAASFAAEAFQLIELVQEGGGRPRRIALLTGSLAAPLMAATAKELSRISGLGFEALVVENRLFGRHVTVTGLLGGADIANAAGAAGLNEADLLLLPSSCLESSGEQFLDSLSLEELRERLSCAVAVV